MTDVRSTSDEWENAPCRVALFSADHSTLLSTLQIRRALPEVDQGLNATLGGFHLEMPTADILKELDRESYVNLFGKRTDGSIWHLQLTRNERTIALQAEDVTDDYDELLRKRVLLDLADKTPDGLAVVRRNLSTLWHNNSLQALLGLEPHADPIRHMERNHRDAGVTGEALEIALDQARLHGFYSDNTTVARNASESAIDISRIIVAHKDPLTGDDLFSAIVRNISDLKKTERELQMARNELQHLLQVKDLDLDREKKAAVHSRDIWRSLVEQNRDLVLFTDTQGLILFANRGFLPGEGTRLIGSRVFSMIAPRDRMAVLEAWQDLIDGDMAHVNTEARIICPDGHLRYCVMLINRLERRDGDHAATWIISDATESRETRDRLLANEKMAATGRMAARIAHEINNPLAAIKSSMEMVRLDTGEGHPASEYIELMDKELTRVSNIIRQMYGLYRPEQDKARPLDISMIISDCLTLLDSSARQRGIDLHRSPTEPVMVTASESGLRQILFNMVQNALDVSPDGSSIRVEIEPNGSRVEVRVLDQGPGIDPDIAEQLFEPFFTTKDSYGGSGLGLGLPVSASLAKGMAGDLQLSNIPGGGACATLTLPGTEATDQ